MCSSDLNASNPLPQLQSGQLRAIAVAAPQRLAGAYAQVPTWKEQGVASNASFWRGAIGPRGLTASQVAFWDAEFARLVKTEEWLRYLETGMLANDYLGSRDSQRFLEAEAKEYRAILTELGLARP